MRTAKPFLLVTTPIGVAGGLKAAYDLAGGLVFLMAVMVAVAACGIGSIVYTIHRESAGAKTDE